MKKLLTKFNRMLRYIVYFGGGLQHLQCMTRKATGKQIHVTFLGGGKVKTIVQYCPIVQTPHCEETTPNNDITTTVQPFLNLGGENKELNGYR